MYNLENELNVWQTQGSKTQYENMLNKKIPLAEMKQAMQCEAESEAQISSIRKCFIKEEENKRKQKAVVFYFSPKYYTVATMCTGCCVQYILTSGLSIH